MHRLKQMKETLMNCVQTEINGHLDQADAKELGEAVDMIKDLSEAIYYCTITEAMEKSDKDEKKGHEYHTMYYPVYMDGTGGGNSGNGGGGTGNGRYYLDNMDRDFGRRYYGNSLYNYNPYSDEGFQHLSDSDRGAINYPNGRMMKRQDEQWDKDKEYKEGKSPKRRRMYMEGKEMHHDKTKQMKELEEYMQELTQDIVEMIEDASPEEKQVLQQKLTMLSAKVK